MCYRLHSYIKIHGKLDAGYPLGNQCHFICNEHRRKDIALMLSNRHFTSYIAYSYYFEHSTCIVKHREVASIKFLNLIKVARDVLEKIVIVCWSYNFDIQLSLDYNEKPI